MKNGIVKTKHVKPIQEKLQKIFLEVITDACVKIAVLEICSEKNTRESVFETCVWGRFWLLKGQGFWVNSWKKENLREKYFSDNVESSSKVLWKVIPADIKNWWKTRNNGTGNCILYLFTEVPSQNLKYNVKQACIFNLIMVGIPSSLILYVMKRRGGGGERVQGFCN